MKTALIIIQIVLSIILTALIFLQSNGDTESNNLASTNVQKRGWEKVVFNFTIFVVVLFLISSIIQTLI